MSQSGLLEAKAVIIAAFAGGPGILIDDDNARRQRIIDLLALIEVEFEAESAGPARSNVTHITSRTRLMPITGDVEHASNARINWPQTMEQLRLHPGVSKTVTYDKMHTAVASATNLRKKYPDVDILTMRNDDGSGAMVLTFEPRRH